ncbi:MAG: serine hydrolase domain-containing protein [Salinarimonas sp.]
MPSRTRRLFRPSARLLARAAAASLLACLAAPVAAQEAAPGAGPDGAAAAPTADASDPGALGWMRGFPPPEERIVRFADGSYFEFPAMRWTVCHFRELMPTRVVSRDPFRVADLPRDERPDIAEVTFEVLGTGETMNVAEALPATFTDGLVVLHEGRIVFERYAGCLEPEGVHAAMSVTKSMTGLLAEILVADGVLDETARVDAYVPELAASGFGDATVRQVMDMTTAIDFSEDYTDPDAEVWRHAAAGSPLPKPPDYEGPRTYYEFLVTVEKTAGAEHGEAFGYRTANSDVLGWIVARVAGMPVTELLSERVWRPMGAELDGYLTVDSIGTPFAGGGLNAGLRDLARVGQLLLDAGRIDGRQVLPAAAVASILGGGDREAFAKAGYDLLEGWSYRGMWWVSHDPNGTVLARGVHGQTIWVDPTTRMVIARFASHPTAGNAANDPITLPAFRAIARHLAGG